MTVYEDLQWRGLIESISDPALIDKLNEGGLTFYIGTDPTADSLHLGHYSSFLITRRLAEAGHHPLILVGGATGLVGDPRGTVERALSQKEVVFRNFEALKAQVQKLFPYPVVNNYDWIKDMNVLDFFRDIGKFINVGYMLSKDHVKRQMETGISYAEFSYMLIQGYDFKYLHEHMNVDLQVAGSDQWGNITTGIELIRKTTGETVYAMTMPLITDSQGNKFGKSEGNAVWLDKNKTSSYELYQFLLNAEDVMAVPYLKRLTFLSREEIEEIERQHNEQPHLRLAQKALAKEIITDLHGDGAYEEAVRISEQLFSGDIKSIPPQDLLAGLKNVPHFEIPEGTRLLDALKLGGAASSNREGNDFLKAGAVSLNGDIEKDGNVLLTKENAIDGKFIVIRRGKKKYYVATFC
ncbi:MAG: tyrosine--tRNA ligase [Clostridia bacterium]|nr:tyrosine--tRNA ligase [Clostridia bacterium]MBQ9794261.1 tyrosine--tRNA ligase [Clostridia bacterium]MBR4054835.1 tyrosine--tRNA ligase [Clostridia bacterium]